MIEYTGQIDWINSNEGTVYYRVQINLSNETKNKYIL